MSLGRLWLPLVASLLVAACGGGGDDAAPAPGNSAPAAVNDAATTAEDTAVTIDVLANDTDADGQADLDPATVTVVAPVQGSATVDTTTGRVTFTPAANYNGPASFAYTVRDRAGAVSNQADVSITVTAVNDAPAISDIADRSTTLNTSTGPVPFTIGDADHAAAGLAVTGTSSNTTLVPNANIQFGGSGTSRTVTVTPATGRSGTATITVRVSDGAAAATDAFVLTVNPGPPNQAPMARNDSATTAEDTAVAIDVLANDLDPDGSLDQSSVTITAQSKGVALPAGNGVVTFTPDANYNGAAGFTYTVKDNIGAASNPATVAITVTAVNDAPVAQAASYTLDEDGTVSGQLVAQDVDGDTLTFAKASDPANGTLTLDGANFSYAPDLNFAGNDSFTFVANDGTADSAPAPVSITVNDTSEAALTVTDAGAAENAGPLTFTVTLSRAPDAPVTIHYQTADGTATAGSDYTATSGDLQFAANSALSQNVTVAVTNDAFHEADESMTLALNVAAGADSVESGADLEATGTITNDDAENTTLLRVGAAKRSVKPSQTHIDGILENRLGGVEPTQRTQKFNLGGFGINPTQSLPNPADQAGEALTQPAKSAAFSGSRGEEPIHLRVMLVEQKGGERLAFVMLDAIGAGNVIQDGVKAAVNRATGIEPQNILFGQTHTHAGPDLQGLWGGVPEDWVENTLYVAAEQAAAEALAARRPARLMLAQGHTVEFNNYRRPKIDPNADADGTLTLLRAVAEDGTPLGAILQYNAHPTSINENPRAVHADYIQGAMDWLEDSATGPGGVALYYNGPIADASGSGGRAGCQPAAQDGDYGNVRCRGEGIASQALQFTERELAPTLVVDEREVILPITNPGFLAFGAIGSFNRYYNFMQQVPVESIPGVGAEARNLPQLTPTATTLVSRVTIGGAEGGLEIVTIPGETTNTFGQYIRGLAKTNVMLLGLTHNSFGYIIPEEEFSYVDQEGDDGLVAPFTGYEENVSLGPLTAPLLRTQGYNMLFGTGPAQDIPPTLSACLTNAESAACVVQIIENRLDALVGGLSACVESGLGANGCPLRTTLDMTLGELASQCRDFDGPDAFCALFDTVRNTGIGEAIPELDMALLLDAAQAQTAGCDLLDPSNCLYPFPNDWFTAAAAPGSIQDTARGGTGRRVNISPAATPRNTAGKLVDPTEWNRSDGFSPGALVATYVPGLSLEQTFSRPAHEIGVANLALSQQDDAPILVFEVQDDGSAPVKHLVWSEIDQNANLLTVVGAPNVGVFPVPGATNEYGHVPRPLNDGRAALLIRPAKNFAEGKRYVVVLRNLKDRYGNAIKPQPGFRACLSGGSTLPPVQQRCEQLEDKVFPVLEDAGIAVDGSVFLAWDFTVESTESAIGRLRHMRDDAFATLSANPAAEDCTQLTPANAAVCAAPEITITGTMENPQGGIARRIEGTITVPNYLAPVGPSPLDDPNVSTAVNTFCANAPEGEFASGCRDLRDIADLGQGAALPSRLFYSPADGTPTPDQNNATDPSGLRYGDGLPDRNGAMTTRFLCQIPAQATPDNPARASLYGHGQLDRGVAITYEGTPDVAREHNYMFCAVDWFGFRTGDAVNVLSSLVDLSNFPVVPDASQQGMLNFMFLARAMQHPQGFAALPEFQDTASGRPVFDRGEIFYNGNSQGGIFGGVVLAASKDVNRGVLGSVGMNYSTLLTRSKNFDEYAGLLYNSYTDPLDRQLLFSMMQMLWDRSENNAYASHLVDNSAFGGPSNVVKVDPMFGDPQVTMYSAEVMARTMGVPFDNRQTLHVETLGSQYLGVNGRRHPAVEPYYGLAPLDYGSDAVKGGALMVWDTNHAGEFAHIPPITNTAPRTGRDPHDASQKARYGRCQMAHFLRTDGELIDILPVQFGGQPCPAVPAATPTTVPGAAEPGLADALSAAVGQFVAAVQEAFAALTGGDPEGAAAILVAGAGQLGSDVSEAVLGGGNELPGPLSTDRLYAGAAEGPTSIPVGTPLGGYLRPPVGGDFGAPLLDKCESGPNEECLEVLQGPVFAELADFIPSDQDHDGAPIAPVPDEARVAHSPYATISPPSRGYYDSLITKAVALRNGDKTVVLVKLDMIGMIDEVVVDVAERVKQRTGVDLSNGGLMMSGTHTHDGPGALANHALRFFWVAMDVYQHEVYVRVVDSIADTVVAALGDMKPARFGYSVGVDTTNSNKYRRGQDLHDQSKNAERDYVRQRIGVLRIDDADGNPLAAIVNYSAHGIAFDVDNQFFSGDVMGSVERELSYTFDRPVVVMSVQSAGGDVSPNVWRDPSKLQGIERFGKRLAPVIRSVYDSVANFDDAPVLKSVSQRIVLNLDTLGYTDNEYPYPYGAIECNAAPVPDGCLAMPPPDAEDLADNGVGENKAWGPGDTRLTSIRIGDAVLIGQPGETLTEFGRQILERSPFGRDKTFIWGTSQDHVGYLLADNKEDWQRGGTEGTTTFWGWKLATRLHRGYDELNQVLLGNLEPGDAGYPADEFAIKYTNNDVPATPARTLPSARPGRVITQPAAIARFAATTFSWEGGDPVVDLPRVEMQRLDESGQWEVVRRGNGTPLDTFFEMHLEYQLATGAHQWLVHFEAPKDWVIGTYRFVVSGAAAIAPVATAHEALRQSYAVASDGFAVTVAGSLRLSAPVVDGGVVRTAMTYEPRPSNYRIIDINVDPRNAAPVRGGRATFTNGTDTVVDGDADGDGVYQADIAGTVTVSSRDAFGNTAAPVSMPADDGDGDGISDGNDNCPTAANGDQLNTDGDAEGNACDADDDNDGVADGADQCPVQAGAASNNGCPEQGGGEGLPLCEHISGEGYCLSDIDQYLPVPVGSAIQGLVDTVYNTVTGNGGGEPPPAGGNADYGSGVIGLLAELVSDLNGALTAAVSGDPDGVQAALNEAGEHAQENGENLADSDEPGEAAGLDEEPAAVIKRARAANRNVEPVILTGAQLAGWSAPAALGVARAYPSGAGQYYDSLTEACGELPDDETPFPTGPLPNNLRGFCEVYLSSTLDQGPHGDQVWTDQVRNAYNGTMLHPLGWRPGQAPVRGGVPVNEIAAFRWNAETSQFEEIPVQVDERKPYFLANANAGFSFYSGTDEELSYAWDTESWGMTKGECSREYDPAGWDQPLETHDRNSGISQAIPDPVAGLDQDDEVVFMAADAGPLGPTSDFAPAWKAVQVVRLNDALDPAAERVVYLVQKAGGSQAGRQYVSYVRDADADQWIDRSFFADNDPLKLGTSNTGYGPNLRGTVCKPGGVQASNDRFPRDGVTVSTDTYRWQASGRWMLRDLRVREPGVDNPDPAYWTSRQDLVDRWKGRAFQQSPDSTVSLVGFEDEQVNWEANSALLGERCGPVRCMREVWGADSGTNVTKTETFYRDVVTYRYHVRVHPIPPDGLYTSWDYNRSAMMNPKTAGAEGRYFTVLRPQGVPIDGKNDDVGQIDDIGGFPAFFDAADPTFNLPLAFDNWEQVSGKDDLGSLVYIFELKGPTSLLTPAVVPYYRDDACLDDGTGDDPVQRPYPGESTTDSRVQAGYAAAAGKPYAQLSCAEKQGAYAQHGVHYFFTSDVDNATLPKAVNEIDGQQWQFMVPTAAPMNVAEPYANVVRVPLVAVVVPLTPPAAPSLPVIGDADERGLAEVVADFVAAIAEAVADVVADSEYLGPFYEALQEGINGFVGGIADLLIGNDHASVLAVAADVVGSPTDAPDDVAEGGNHLVNGYSPDARGRIYAGVGVVDMTPDVGYGAGQYANKVVEETPDGTVDPYATARAQVKSYGVMSRLTGRAIVVEGANGKRIALLKSDNYLAQDNLIRRVSQILEESGSTIGYDQILYGVTHAHSTSYYSTLSAGVWLFQDVYEARFFENQARKLAQAILIAERNLKPARMGATTVRHKVFKGNIADDGPADDGTPAGYPAEYGDHGLVVMRFDEVDDSGAFVAPMAIWMNWGEHPEGLDGYDLHSGDYVAFLERYVDRELGAPLVFSQGDVGSSEKSGNDQQRLRDDGSVCQGPAASGPACAAGEGVWRDWNHKGYVQNERNARFLADAVVKGWKVIGGELPIDDAGARAANNHVASVQVSFSDSFPVDYRNAWVPGPLSHPYPGVSACRTEPTAEGNPGAPNAADCKRPDDSDDRGSDIWETMKAEGLPVPENYELPAFGIAEENLRLKLQAFRLGDVVLGSCACEAQADLILNFESRADDVAGNIHDGFDWACLIPEMRAGEPAEHTQACERQAQIYDPAEFPYDLQPRGGESNRSAAAIAHMRAQVHNDAAGWDAPEYVPYANAEPADPALIKGNFTKEELPVERGYKLAVGVGHAGDYNGYTVSYREYMSYDHYRKDLTAYGSHTADYMVTRLVRMAGAMKGGPELAPEPHDTTAQVDEARQVAVSRTHGQATREAYETYYAALPPDAGAVGPLEQPQDIGYFQAATFTWRGGATAVDNPRVDVERCVGASDETCNGGTWQRYANQTGEVQTRVQWPTVDELPRVYAGQFNWRWTANFEAYEAFPARLGITPAGFYRFIVEGCINDGSAPDQNLFKRLSNFFGGLLPQDVTAGLLEPLQCRGGASMYRVQSDGFEVTPPPPVVKDVRHDASGDLGIQVAPTSIPRSYTSALFPYLRDDGGSRFCRECSFRPWATSTAAATGVLVEVNGLPVPVTGAGGNWVADANLAEGQSALITVSYADGRAVQPYTYTRAGAATADEDGDGVMNHVDNCPTMANADQADNDSDGSGNACDATPNGETAGSDTPQLCTPDETPGIPGECAANNDGEAIQDAVDEIYGALPEPAQEVVDEIYGAITGGL